MIEEVRFAAEANASKLIGMPARSGGFGTGARGSPRLDHRPCQSPPGSQVRRRLSG